MDILIISIISGTILGFLAEPIYNGMDKLLNKIKKLKVPTYEEIEFQLIKLYYKIKER